MNNPSKKPQKIEEDKTIIPAEKTENSELRTITGDPEQ